MKFHLLMRVAVVALLAGALALSTMAPGAIVAAQSGRQPPKKKVEKKADEQNKSGQPATPERQDPQDPVPPIPKGIKDEPPIKISTQVVNVAASVIDKKSGRLIPNLTQKNFTVLEDGVKQEVSNFGSGDGPITVVLLLENNYRNRRWQGYYNPTFAQEVFQSAAVFVQSFVKREDFAAIVTYSMKPKVVQDFTSDPSKLYNGVLSAYRDTLNFSEANLYDALSFVLLGGKAYQLYDEGAGQNEYLGLQEVEGRTAVILVAVGVDTFSKLTYDKALKIVAQAGVPVFPVGVGNLFFKKYEAYLGPEDRLTFLQAMNSLNAFAERSGGAYFPMTFESEIPSIMRNIETLLRNQYSVGYVPGNTRREGKERKIVLEVDVDGDGQPDNKKLELKYRTRYVEPDDRVKK